MPRSRMGKPASSPTSRNNSHQPPLPSESNHSDANSVSTPASASVAMLRHPLLSGASRRPTAHSTARNHTETGSQARTSRPSVTLAYALRSLAARPRHVAWPAQAPARPCACHLAVIEHLLAVHEHVGDAGRRLVRVLEGRAVDDRRRVEHGDVGEKARLEEPAPREPDALRRERGRLADRELERHELLVAHVVP